MAEQRECMMMIATGMMKVGKSWATQEFIELYIKHHPTRRVIIWDPNADELFEKYDSIDWDIEAIELSEREYLKKGVRTITVYDKYLSNIQPGQIRKILPFTKSGLPMGTDQKRITMIRVIEFFRAGLILIDDPGTYLINWEASKITGPFNNIRHRSQDIIIHLQGMNPLRTIHYQAISVLRMHYDGVSVDRFKNKLGGLFEIVKLAQLIVEREYRINENIRFYCYVHTKAFKIRGITPDQFRKACEDYFSFKPSLARSIPLEKFIEEKTYYIS